MTQAPLLDPVTEFRRLFALASDRATGATGETAATAATADPIEMTLATVDGSGAPSARIVLLKGVREGGFEFFTNYESRKGRELEGDPRAALVWRWPWVEQQIRAEGITERLSAAESDAYFASRPRGHQIGGWASAQSRVLGSYGELESRVVEMERRFAGGEVPRPPHWGGYLLRPLMVEFWQGRLNRLHERRRFRRAAVDADWESELLSP